MAITINWPTGVINVPKADLTLIQSTPIEIRELNLETFRATLNDLQDDEEGIPWPTTHEHYTSVNVGGVSLAHVLIILEPYTITFEDGQYAVNLVGANSNVADRVNVNQVSVRSANSAGLAQMREIEYSSFNGGVTMDVLSSYFGTTYPVGTPRQPVNNLADALLIASVRGFNTLYIIGDITIGSGEIIDNYILIGQNPMLTTITIESGASTEKCEFKEATMTGYLQGDSMINCCRVNTLTYVEGCIHDSLLVGTITLSGTTDTNFVNCADGLPGYGIPVIDMGGSGRSLGVWGYHGGLKIQNKSGADDTASVNMDSGRLILDSSVTAGDIIVRGIGHLEDNSVGATVNSDGLLSLSVLVQSVWSSTDGETVRKMLYNKVTRSGDVVIIYEDNGVDVWKQFDLADGGRVLV